MYLADRKYCEQDYDSKYRADFCDLGAFNLYHQFRTPWGCEPVNFENFGIESESENFYIKNLLFKFFLNLNKKA